jgi:Zn finger protein HypA/HybF involved in hydrogenase expression
MPESAYEKARRHSGTWDYGQKYNATGEFNPRMISCDNCGDYKEPDEMINSTEGDTLCPTCHENLNEPNPEIVERRSGGYPTI